MNEGLTHDDDPAQRFRLEQVEVHDWATNILVTNHGSIIDADPESRGAIDFIKELRRHTEGEGAYGSNEMVREVTQSVDIAALQQRVLKRNIEGLAELSEGLVFYGDVQAVIVDTSGRDRVIDVKGIVITDPANYAIGLVDEQGETHAYDTYRALLVPVREDEAYE